MRRACPPHRLLHDIGFGTLLVGFFSVGAAAAMVDPSGEVSLPAVTIPFSSLASAEAHHQFVDLLSHPSAPAPGKSVAEMRQFYDDFNTSLVERMRKRYAVSVRSESLGGVVIDVVTPAQGSSLENQTRVLINLHGGAFMWGAHSGGLVESVPIASVGKIKVITIDYREGPENRFPAANDDVAAVYSALLKHYRPSNIGIYGCSAGGLLTAESVAAFHAKGLPNPGAIGTFCASLVDTTGDSSLIAPMLGGQPYTQKPLSILDLPYFKDVNRNDPMVFPGVSNEVLAHFPPTLLITGTRDFAMSSVVRSHALLTDAHVEAELHVYEGMWHAFLIYPELPESIAAYSVITQFFERHLGN